MSTKWRGSGTGGAAGRDNNYRPSPPVPITEVTACQCYNPYDPWNPYYRLGFLAVMYLRNLLTPARSAKMVHMEGNTMTNYDGENNTIFHDHNAADAATARCVPATLAIDLQAQRMAREICGFDCDVTKFLTVADSIKTQLLANQAADARMMSAETDDEMARRLR